MPEWLSHMFAAVCGQNPEHTWAPGGLLLPCCQRCTGLYVGAAVAAVLHGWLKPRLTGRFLGMHGLFLLLMVPFGYHWLPQESVLRTSSGVLFGFGLVTFLWLPSVGWKSGPAAPRPGAAPVYAANVAWVLVLLPMWGVWGGRFAAFALSGFTFCGAATLLVLVLANVSLGAMALGRLILRLTTRTAA